MGRIGRYGAERRLDLVALWFLVAVFGAARLLLLGLVRAVELIGGLALTTGAAIRAQLAVLDLVMDPSDAGTADRHSSVIDGEVVSVQYENEMENVA